MFANTWNGIIDWFRDRSERNRLVRTFNAAARESFVDGNVPTLLKARISSGDRAFKHQFSDWLHTGFRIQAFRGQQLTKEEMINIGAVIISDSALMRKLVVLGFDTLEVCSDVGTYGLKWQIKDHLQLSK